MNGRIILVEHMLDIQAFAHTMPADSHVVLFRQGTAHEVMRARAELQHLPDLLRILHASTD